MSNLLIFCNVTGSFRTHPGPSSSSHPRLPSIYSTAQAIGVRFKTSSKFRSRSPVAAGAQTFTKLPRTGPTTVPVTCFSNPQGLLSDRSAISQRTAIKPRFYVCRKAPSRASSSRSQPCRSENTHCVAPTEPATMEKIRKGSNK